MQFTCGIEIHQRLATSKLFCACKSEGEEQPIARISRKLRAVAGELGEIDRAAQEEMQRDRTFTYLHYPTMSCLVELDCEPPHRMNMSALEIVLGICMLLKCDIVDEIQVMRKTVVDGSNTSGFQRTAIVGMNGVLDTSEGPVGIQTVCIEEESAGIVEPGVFSLDRLGIPLVEIATAPDIKSPAHAREVAEKLGTILRMTGKVARGIGTIRQDINISIPGGARVEIKGAQELALIPTWIEQEITRQQNLLCIKSLLHERNVSPALLRSQPVVVLKREGWKLKFPGSVVGVRLPFMRGILGMEIQKERRFGTELADHAKAYGFKGIIHGDENLEKYGIGSDVWEQLSCGKEDSFILIVGEEARARRALTKIVERIARACEGVPEETRRANPDGTTSYMRPLPGKSRLYPETDVPTISVAKELLERVAKTLPPTLEETEEQLVKELGKELAGKMIKSRKFPLFKKLWKEGHDPKFVASVFENTAIRLRREGYDVEQLSEEEWEDFFTCYREGLMTRNAAPEVLIAYLKAVREGSERRSFATIIRDAGLLRITGDELKKIVEEEKRDFAVIMKKYGKRIDADEVKRFL